MGNASSGGLAYVPGGAGGNGAAVSISGNTSGTVALVSTGTLVLAGGNNITLSQSGQSITVSGANAGGAQTGISSVVVSNTTYTSGAVSFSNANGITFGSSAGQAITASYNSTQFAGTGTAITGNASITLNSAGISFNGADVAGTATAVTGSLSMTMNSNGLSFNGSNLVGNNTAKSGAIAFTANSSGISINATSLAGTATAITGNASITLNTAGLSFNGTSLAGVGTSITGNASITMNSAGIQFNGSGLAGTNTGATNATITANSSGVSVSVAAPVTASIGVSTGGNTAGNTGTYSGQVVFAGGNNITLSVSSGAAGAQTITISGANVGGAQTGISGIIVSNTTYTSGTVSFSNANGITFGSSAGQAITASYNSTQFAGTGTSITGNASITLNSNGIAFNGSGLAGTNTGATNATITANSSGVSVSVPATSSLSATGGLSISVNASTISIGNGVVSRFIYPDEQLTALSAPGNGSLSLQYLQLQNPLTATRLDALVGWSGASAATTATMGIAISAWAIVYTNNASTLSSLSSGSTQTTYTYASNSAGNTQLTSPGIRPISVPINLNMTQGSYIVGFNFSTNSSSVGASTTNLGQTLSMYGGAQIQTASNYAEFTAASATSTNQYGGMGVYTAATGGAPVSINLNAIAQTGASLSQANIALVFRNV